MKIGMIERLVNLVKRERPVQERTYVRRQQAGVFVSEDTALTHAAVWAAVRLISETIGSLPWRVHQKIDRGNKILEGTLDYLLHIEANPEMSAMVFRELMLSHALTWGNGYAEIERDNKGEPWNLWPLPPDKIYPDRTKDGRIWYLMNGQPVLEQKDIYHLKGLGFDGMVGYSVIRMASKSLGVGMALDSMAASTFANGAVPGGVITQKEGKALSPDAAKNLIKAFEEKFKGPDNARKVAYLDSGMTYETIGQPLDDIQFLESRKFQTNEVARWFRVPPHKLGDLERATFSNIEHQSLEFVTDTLVPWIARLESEAQIKLIGRNNRAGRVYTKINVNALLRGDMASRYAAYGIGRDKGWLSANDIRELEDLNPIKGGDEYLVQSQMVPQIILKEIHSKPEPEPQPAEPQQPTMRAVK